MRCAKDWVLGAVQLEVKSDRMPPLETKIAQLRWAHPLDDIKMELINEFTYLETGDGQSVGYCHTHIDEGCTSYTR